MRHHRSLLLALLALQLALSQARTLDQLRSLNPNADDACHSKGGTCLDNAVSKCQAPSRIELKLCGGGADRKCCVPPAADPSAKPVDTTSPGSPPAAAPTMWEKTKSMLSAAGAAVVTFATDAWNGFRRTVGSFGSTPTPPTPSPSAPSPSAPGPATPAAGDQPQPSTAPGSKETAAALRMIFGHEGKCTNNAGDSGNHFDGRVGYTCMGVTPKTGWTYRKYYSSDCKAKCVDKVLFTKCCYDLSHDAYRSSTEDLYEKEFFERGGCTTLPWPAFYVCADIAINSGIGRSKSMVSDARKDMPCSLSACDGKGFCLKLNAAHRQFYKDIAAKDASKQQFLKGWLKRADDRDKVCKGEIALK